MSLLPREVRPAIGMRSTTAKRTRSQTPIQTDPTADQFYHFNLTEITSPTGNAAIAAASGKPAYQLNEANSDAAQANGAVDPGTTLNSFTISYDYDHSHLEYWADQKYQNTNLGVFEHYIPQQGLPRIVTAVQLPSIDGQTSGPSSTFQSASRVFAIQRNSAAQTAAPRRLSAVQDTEGAWRVYDCSTFGYVTQDNLSQFLIPANGNQFTGFARYMPALITCGKWTVSYPSTAPVFDTTTATPGYTASGPQESYTFQADAGSAVASITDLNGNTQTFTYSTPIQYAQTYTQFDGLQLPDGTIATPGLNYYSEPDALDRTDASSGKVLSKSYAYTDPATFGMRLLTGVLDEANCVTGWKLDALGRTVEKKVADGKGTYYDATYSYDGGVPSFAKSVTEKSGVQQVNDVTSAFSPDSATGMTAQVNAGYAAANLSYDNNGNVTKAIDGDQNETDYTYDDQNRLVRTDFPDGTFDTYAYDTAGNVTSMQDENGATTNFSYDYWDRRVSVTRKVRGGSDLTTSVTYNTAGSILSETDARGNTTKHLYDGFQRLTETDSPTVTTTDNGAVTYKVTYDYSGANSGPTGLNPASFAPTDIKDASGYHTKLVYDGFYRKTQETRDIGPGGNVANTFSTFTWDDVGTLNSVAVRRTDATGPVTLKESYSYDGAHRLLSTTKADNTSTSMAYAQNGLNYQYTDEAGYTTTFTYDGLGRITDTKGPGVDGGNPETSIVYDGNSNVSTKKIVRLSGVTEQWDYGYDSRNRQTLVTEPSAYIYLTGDVRASIQTGYDGVGNATSITDPYGYVTTKKYDDAFRLIEVDAPSVSAYASIGGVAGVGVTKMAYDANGNVLTTTDANSHTTTNTYDEINRMTGTVDAEGNKVSFTYDAVNNRTSVTDGKNQKTSFGFDGLRRMISQTDAAGRSASHNYNELVETKRTDSSGHPTVYSYDQENRLKEEKFSDAAAGVADRVYGYDSRGNLTGVSETGPNSAARSFATCAYSYDNASRLTSETSNGVATSYGRDLAGNITQITYGSNLAGGPNRVVTQTFDNMNRLASMTDGGSVTSYQYDARGMQCFQQLPNGDQEICSYDELGRLVEKTVTGVSDYVMGYDLVGNVAGVSETYASNPSLNRTVLNGYDKIYRLTSESVQGAGAVSTLYAYDAANNRTNKTVTSGLGSSAINYVFGNALNQLTSSSDGASYQYDKEGNRTLRVQNGVTTSYTYDRENRLLAVSIVDTNSGTTHNYGYDYDSRSRRVVRTQDGAETEVVFSGGVSAEEYVPAGKLWSLSAEYLRGNDMGGGVGGLLYSVRSGLASYTHANERGDVTSKTDQNGSITYQSEYEAFGTRPLEIGSSADPQRANTKEEDPDGLLNEGMRYRDLATGTFITRDPAGFVDGPNMYAYCVQNPWTKFDPDGLAAAITEDQRRAMVLHSDEVAAGALTVKDRADRYRALGWESKANKLDVAANELTEKSDFLQLASEVLSTDKSKWRQAFAARFKESDPEFMQKLAFFEGEFNDPWLASTMGEAIDEWEAGAEVWIQLNLFLIPGGSEAAGGGATAQGAKGFTLNPWTRFITGTPTKSLPEARFSFYRAARSDEFARIGGFSRIGVENRAEYAAFLRAVRSASFRESGALQGGFAGIDTTTGQRILAVSRGNVDSSFALNHELTHFARDFKRITPFEAEASMQGIYRYRAWIEEVKTYRQQFFGPSK